MPKQTRKSALPALKLTPAVRAIFPQPPSVFPVKPWKSTRLVAGRTLVRTGRLHTAALLVENKAGAIKIRLNTFQRHKDGTWGSPQWIMVTPTCAERLLETLDLYLEAIAPVRKRSRKR